MSALAMEEHKAGPQENPPGFRRGVMLSPHRMWRPARPKFAGDDSGGMKIQDFG